MGNRQLKEYVLHAGLRCSELVKLRIDSIYTNHGRGSFVPREPLHYCSFTIAHFVLSEEQISMVATDSALRFPN